MIMCVRCVCTYMEIAADPLYVVGGDCMKYNHVIWSYTKYIHAVIHQNIYCIHCVL